MTETKIDCKKLSIKWLKKNVSDNKTITERPLLRFDDSMVKQVEENILGELILMIDTYLKYIIIYEV